MKINQSILTGWPLVIALAAAAGCSGNPDGLAGPSGDDTIAPVLTRGIVSRDNGLTIGGQSMSLQTVIVEINGESGSISSLEDGMWVTVEQQDGVILSVSYDEDVKGPIDSVELDGTFSVLGQLVRISPNTVFDDSGPDALRSGDVVEISGLRDSVDNLTASRIELRQSETDAWSVRGQIRQLDRSLKVFVIGGLTVNYSQARFDDMNESSLQNGLAVEVKDESRTYEPGSLYLNATKIENQESSYHYQSSTSTSSNSSTSSTPFTNSSSSTNSGLSSSSTTDSSSSTDSGSTSSLDDNNVPSLNNSTFNDEISGDPIEVEIDGIVTGVDSSAGTLQIEGLVITISFATEYRLDDDRHVSRDEFFARLRQGVSVIKIKWRHFTGYDQPPYELEFES